MQVKIYSFNFTLYLFDFDHFYRILNCIDYIYNLL